MNQQAFDVLGTIVAATRRRVEAARERQPLSGLLARAASRQPRPEAFLRALAGNGARDAWSPRVIAECKRRSPSRGVLREDYDPLAIARAYEAAGAVALSVLTEPSFFDGALSHLAAVREAVALPVLRKDFVVDEYQLVESRAAGADAVLLIVAALEDAEIARLLLESERLELAALVEVHDGEELRRAVAAGARAIGVNNRNLRTLAVDLDTSAALASGIPDGCVAVAESGLRSPDDLRRLAEAGYDAFLIGERCMTAADPGLALRELVGGTAGDAAHRGRVVSRVAGAFDEAVGARGARPHVKVCGITRAEDAVLAAECGASAVGFVFWDRSPRAVSLEVANAVAADMPRGLLRVGVFVNALPHVVRRYVAEVPLDVVQLHGDEPVEWAATFTRPVLKAVNPADAAHTAWLATPPDAVTLLVDAVDAERRGGTGKQADWEAAAALARRRPIVLAGGLSPENVSEAVRRVRPYGVDVSSGVEARPGIKDASAMRAFFAAVAEGAGS